MPTITTEITIAAPVAAVWAELERIEDHVHWMADAETIRFIGDQHRGAGTAFECVTRVGPLRTVDKMTITEWTEGSAMAVAHTGVVTGSGRFTLTPAGPSATTLQWAEDLRLPRWALGRAGWLLAGPVLRRIWRGNLRRFAGRVKLPS